MMPSHILLHSLVRWMDLAGMSLLMGGLVFRTLVVSPSPGQAYSLERLLPFLLLVIGLGDLALRSQMISGQPLGQVWPFLPAVLFKSHFGKVWMARMFLLCLLGTTAIIKGRTREGIAVTAGAFLLLTASLSGHAADSGDFSLAVLVDWLHLLAVSAWVGGLLFLGRLLRKEVMLPASPTLITSARRFSALAGYCVIVVLATGGYQIWHQVGSLDALFKTPYGQALLVKLVIVLFLLGLGATNRYYILPQLVRREAEESATAAGGPLRKLLHTLSLEIGIGLAVILCAAFLMQLPPARGQWTTAYKASAHPMNHTDQGEMRPSKLHAAEGASVTILSPKKGQVFKGDRVPIHFKLTKGKIGSHVHAYVDGELMGMFQTERGTLTGIRPGRHTLEVRVVAKDHETELDAVDKVEFVVK